MASIRSVKPSERSTYHAFLKSNHGAAIKQCKLLIGQAVTFRGQHLTVSGSDDDSDGGTTVRMVNARIDKEVLFALPTEIEAL